MASLRALTVLLEAILQEIHTSPEGGRLLAIWT